MPRIDQLVDATVGHPRMSFLDAFQGYHQIPLALDDQKKTAFVTPVGNYHYKVMRSEERRVGKESLGQALLRSVKFTHTRHFPIFFFTTMVLTNH